MISPFSRIAIATGLTLSLAACGLGGDGEGIEAEVVKGDVLEGSASDEMIQYDTLRSQPPLAGRAETEEDADGDADED